MRLVGSDHRPVHKERVVIVLLPADVIDDVVAENVLAVPALSVVPKLTVLKNDRVLVAGALFFCVVGVPDAELVETCVLDPLSFCPHFGHLVRRVIRIELPLTGNTRVVPCVRQEVPKGNLARIHQAESDVVSKVVLTRHERESCWSAERQHMCAFETHPVTRHLVETRSPVRRASVRSDYLVA